MKHLLITGGSGYLGSRLVQTAREDWAVLYTWFAHPIDITGARGAPLDILDRDQVLRLFREFQPHAVIHTAYSQENLDVIVKGTKHIVRASEETGARLLHLSTDAVFDGERGWYREEDIPDPVHPYGKAKAKAETLVAGNTPQPGPDNRAGSIPNLDTAGIRNAVIIRTSLIWGLNPIDPRTLLIKNCLDEDSKPVLFTDEYRSPVWVEELATAILETLSLDFCGIIHLAGPERMSRYDFGIKVAHKLGLNPQGITPGLSRESGLIRPRDCSLDTSLAKKLLRTRISSASQLLG